MATVHGPANKPKILINLSREAIATLGELAASSHRSRSNVVQLLVELAQRDGQVRSFLGGGR
jgi:hypothetical protein